MSQPTSTGVASSYDKTAVPYAAALGKDEGGIPYAKLELELVRRMLGDATGKRVLDIGGGNGQYARAAIKAGAAHVDVVDISPGMMQVGKEVEAQAGRDVIGWHVANAYHPFAGQVPDLPVESYDVVMAIWPFDHVANMTDLEGIWGNIAAYLRPGGKLVAIRMGSPYAKSGLSGKYGARYHDIEPIPGGVRLYYTIAADPPFSIPASTMEASYSGSTDLAKKFGLENYELVPLEDTETVKSDPAFWQDLIEDPFVAAFTARRP